ncbi:MAG: hypothetical protein KHZ58_14920 [Hungatella hathewayi]|nr:hypothetical protein [Hungatella hathewayi]
MRKNRKQITALAMALGMAVTGMAGFESLAAEGNTEVSTVNESGKGTMSMTVEGTIKATQLSVTVPLKAAFDVDPGKSGTAAEDASNSKVDAGIVTDASNYKITNNSATPVWVYISGMAVKTGSEVGAAGKDIALVSTVEALKNTTDGNNVMIAIKKDDQFTEPPMLNAVEGAGKNFWLTAGTDKTYYMDGDAANATTTYGKLESKGKAGNDMSLKVYALTMGDWQDGNKFAVTPTFTVSTKDPSK